ncbi:hypothetical protein D3C73_816280 [compost metagenome]
MTRFTLFFHELDDRVGFGFSHQVFFGDFRGVIGREELQQQQGALTTAWNSSRGAVTVADGDQWGFVIDLLDTAFADVDETYHCLLLGWLFQFIVFDDLPADTGVDDHRVDPDLLSGFVRAVVTATSMLTGSAAFAAWACL